MLERTGNSAAHIYQKESGKEEGEMVTWQKIRSIERFPSLLAGKCSFNFLFSPNFRYYIDVDYEGDVFMVVDTKKDKSYVIPNGLISLSLQG